MEDIKRHANNIRKNIVEMVANAYSGHLGGALSAVEILTILYFVVMDVQNDNIASYDRDRFVLSKGHASAALYAVLFEKGLLKEDLLTYRKLGSKLQGHPNMRLVAGVDMSSGSLGQGIGAAVGMAMANKLRNNKHRVFVLLGDGECQEGEVWEAAMAAAHYHLGNLWAIVDHNGLQISGKTRDVMDISPLDAKFAAFGWNVKIVDDGHDLEKLKAAFSNDEDPDKPKLIIAKTIKGKGISFMEDQVQWHGKTLDHPQYLQAIKELEQLR